MKRILDVIRERWQAAGVPPRPGASDAQVEAFERRWNVTMPTSVRSYFQYLNGTGRDFDDGDAWCYFWPLEEVASVPALLPKWRGIPDYGGIESILPESDSFFVFADHSICVWVYAVQLRNNPDFPAPVVQICGNDWQWTSSSFEGFLSLYAEDPFKIW